MSVRTIARSLSAPLLAGASLIALGAGTSLPAQAAPCSGVCPYNSAYGYISLIRQNPEQDGMRIAGWAVDPDAPTTPVDYVQITVEKTNGTTVAKYSTGGNWYRADIGAAYPQYGPNHGFDATLRNLPGVDYRLCAVAVRGAYQRSLGCAGVDPIVKFAGSSISYDVNRATITPNPPEVIWSNQYDNYTNRDQTVQVSGSSSVTSSHQWTTTTRVGATVGVEMSAKVGIPGVVEANGKTNLQVTGSYDWQRGGSVATTDTWAWSATVVNQARTVTDATITVNKARMSLPWTLNGAWVWRSGASDAASISGTYDGLTSYSLKVRASSHPVNGTSGASTSSAQVAKATRSTQVR